MFRSIIRPLRDVPLQVRTFANMRTIVSASRGMEAALVNRRRQRQYSRHQRPQAQHAHWLTKLLFSTVAAATAVAFADKYRDAFPEEEDFDAVQALAEHYNETSDVQLPDAPLPSETDKLDIDFERALQLVPVLEELIDVGGTTCFAEKGTAGLMEEVSDEYSDAYDNVVSSSSIFKEKLLELKEVSGELFPVLAYKIIDKATERASFSLLTILNEEEFGLQEVLANNHVLNNPRGKIIEAYTDKLHKLGLLDRRHMPLILAIQHAQAMQGESDLARQYEQYQLKELPLDPNESMETMRALLSIYKHSYQRQKRLKDAFEHTVILPGSWSYVESSADQGADTITSLIGDWNPLITSEIDKSQLEYDRFFKALKTEADDVERPVDAYGFICASHFTSFTTQIEKSASGQYTVRLLYIDTIATTLKSFMGSSLLPAIKRTFGDDVNLELYSSVEYTQSLGVGCSYHVPFIVERLRELPDWLAKHEEGYDELPENRRLWAYLQSEGKRFDSETVIHYFEDPMEHYQEKLRVQPKVIKESWTGCVLPLHITAENKETMGRRRNVSEDMPVERELLHPFRVTGEIRVGELLAQQGLEVNLEPGSPRAHQQELSTRVYTHLDVTFNDALDRKTDLKTFTRKDGSTFTKRINRGVDVYREQLRSQLTEFLLMMEPEELDKLTERHSLEEFEQRVCDRVATKAGSVQKAMRHIFFAMVKEKAPEAVNTPEAAASPSATAK